MPEPFKPASARATGRRLAKQAENTEPQPSGPPDLAEILASGAARVPVVGQYLSEVVNPPELGRGSELQGSEFESMLKPVDNGYQGSHRPGSEDYGATGENIEDFFPDIYGPNGLRYYSTGLPKDIERESINAIHAMKGKPEKEVTIYRAAPKNVKTINPGDWVTTSKGYAEFHGEGALEGDYHVLDMKVKAKEIYNNGDSIHEWGYFPQEQTEN